MSQYRLINFDRKFTSVVSLRRLLFVTCHELGGLSSARIFENLDNGNICIELLSGDEFSTVDITEIQPIKNIEDIINIRIKELEESGKSVKGVQVQSLSGSQRALGILAVKDPSEPTQAKNRQGKKSDGKSDGRSKS